MAEATLNVHPTKPLIAPGGDIVEIDAEMISLIQAIWSIPLATIACCQDFGEGTEGQRNAKPAPSRYGGDAFIEYYRGYAWLKMPLPDAQELLNQLLHTTFRDHITLRWRPGSWRLSIPLVYNGSKGIIPADSAQIYFPRGQITDLTAAVIRAGVARRTVVRP